MSDPRPPFDPNSTGAAGSPWVAPGGPTLPPSPPVASQWPAQPGYGWAPTYGPGPGYTQTPGPGFPQPTPPTPASTPAARPTNPRRHNQIAFFCGLLVATALIAAAALVRNGVDASLRTSTQASPPVTAPPASGGSSSSNSPPSTPSGGSSSGSGSTGSSLPTDAITSAVNPGVVDIDTKLGYQQAAAAGTGMVLTSNGRILTNNHVIDGATSITATVVTTGRTYTATVVGTDVTGDIAVLQLQGASGLSTIPLGDSSTVATGDSVVAIGNAGGTGGSPSVVTGSITGLNQSITASDENGSNAEQLSGLLQTNAPIVAGDSGGPLVSTQGKVIGIDTAASSANQFMSQNSTGFAIPINRALDIAKQIVNGDASDTIHIGATGFLGIEMAPTSSSGNSSTSGGSSPFGGGSSGNAGSGSSSTADVPPVVSAVVSGSPADKAGLAAGDTITSFDGTSVTTADGLSTLTHQHHPGDRVSISWTDESGQSHTATVTLTSGPAA